MKKVLMQFVFLGLLYMFTINFLDIYRRNLDISMGPFGIDCQNSKSFHIIVTSLIGNSEILMLFRLAHHDTEL